jgi:hypothetical protein
MSDASGASAHDGGGADTETAKAAQLFDIRRIIGGLFTLYGLILFVAGLVDGPAASKKAGGIDINVWTGLGMLVVGLLMLVWMRLNPLQPPEPSQDGDEGRPTH